MSKRQTEGLRVGPAGDLQGKSPERALPKFAQQMRLIWLDARLECGPMNRADMMAEFQVSQPQVSNDIRQFQSLHPNSIEYDRRKKHYRRPAKAQPAYPDHLRHQVQVTAHAMRLFRETPS